MERRKCLVKCLKNELWNFMVDTHAYCTYFIIDRFIADRLPNMTFCGPARDTVLTNRQTEKLNFDTNYITTKFIRLAALLYILRRKRHRSIQRKKLYLRMSSVLLNSSILEIYGL